ncbi:hypothetical protein EVJ58_g3053 [Rhodofomes roseus]|uniref:Uncharacterized protein n=1 Tax=Rhodofomes roseus TaxID=34475 RepID=A0A4Y9YMZ6_9APHY|nr:hypothetical protein EVJ58_g3053 [Rhodofomes roseus]
MLGEAGAHQEEAATETGETTIVETTPATEKTAEETATDEMTGGRTTETGETTTANATAGVPLLPRHESGTAIGTASVREKGMPNQWIVHTNETAGQTTATML